ncbi:hypothetical protein Tco_0642856, partial [Tanacetum coccineum]
IIKISSDSLEDRKGASKATAPIFYGPSTQGLLDAYGYNTIEEYLSWNYFPSTYNESTDKGNTDKDCIVDSNCAMSKGVLVENDVLRMIIEVELQDLVDLKSILYRLHSEGGQGTEVNDGVDGVPDFSTIIAQQLQNLLSTILAQIGNQGSNLGNGRNQNGNAVNNNIQGDVKYTAGSFVGKALTWWNSLIHTRSREAVEEMEFWNYTMVGVGHSAYTDRFHELARLVLHLVTPENKRIGRYIYGLALQILGMVVAMELKIIQRAMQKAGTLTNEVVRNGSLKKNHEKRRNSKEHSKDRNARDENKRTMTGNAFAITTNPVRIEYNVPIPKCVSCNLHHPPEIPCRASFNYSRPRHMAKDCRVAPRMMNSINARNPTA